MTPFLLTWETLGTKEELSWVRSARTGAAQAGGRYTPRRGTRTPRAHAPPWHTHPQQTAAIKVRARFQGVVCASLKVPCVKSTSAVPVSRSPAFNAALDSSKAVFMSTPRKEHTSPPFQLIDGVTGVSWTQAFCCQGNSHTRPVRDRGVNPNQMTLGDGRVFSKDTRVSVRTWAQ